VSDQVILDLGKPDFDLVEPERVGRCVGNSDDWIAGQKRGDSLGLMSGKVVHDDVDCLVGPAGLATTSIRKATNSALV
jgi:hypothetical protein